MIYNENLDQIVISSRHMDEIYVIIIAPQLKKQLHSGGRYDGWRFLYDVTPKIIIEVQSKIEFLVVNMAFIGYLTTIQVRKFLVFNNPINKSNRSAVLEFENIADENGYYYIDDQEPFGPSTYQWIYLTSFYAHSIRSI